MSIIPMDWDALRSAFERTTTRVAELIRSHSHPGARVTGLDWTVGELAAHLVSLESRYEPFVRGTGKAMPASIPEVNARELAGLSQRSLPDLADMLEGRTKTLVSLCASGDAAARFFDRDTDCASLVALYLEELLVHGFDLARTAGRPWPIDASEAVFAIGGILMVLPSFIDSDAARGFKAVYEIRLRGGPTVAVAFDDGSATVTHGAVRAADCRISAEPVAYLLTALGRQSQWKSALTGKVVAFGRKPWLAMRFEKLIVAA